MRTAHVARGRTSADKALTKPNPTTTPVKTGENVDAAAPVPAVLPHQEVLAPLESSDNGIRIQQLYWKQLIQLKVECEYIRRYQAEYRWWVTRINMAKAVLSAGALGAWAASQVSPLLWGGIIAGVQVADAVQKALPISKQYESLSALVIVLDTLFITALGEWEEIQAGRVDVAALAVARQNLMKQMHDAQAKQFLTGLHRREALFKLAEADAAAYIKATFGMEPV